MKIGRLVSIEGIDGAGKSTLVDKLVVMLGENGLKAKALHSSSFFEADFKRSGIIDGGPSLTLQERAFVSFSRLFDFYETTIQPAQTVADVVLLDRHIWSFLVRWACRDVRWSVLTMLAETPNLVPEPAQIVLLDADPLRAYWRKVSAGIKLSPAETQGRVSTQTDREAFVNLQTRAQGYYNELVRNASTDRVTRIDSEIGEAAVLRIVIDKLRDKKII